VLVNCPRRLASVGALRKLFCAGQVEETRANITVAVYLVRRVGGAEDGGSC